jgi:hypothetical protein
MNDTAPKRARGSAPRLQRRSVCSMMRRKMCSTAVTICGFCWRKSAQALRQCQHPLCAAINRRGEADERAVHRKGVATHGGLESCVNVCKGVGEALTGVRVGEVSSREIIPPGCRRGSGPGRQHDQARYRECLVGPARSKTLCMHDILHAREPGDPSDCPWHMVAAGRIGEAEP